MTTELQAGRTATTHRTQRLVGALALVCLWALGLLEITPSPAIKDASETLQMALNLERHGVVSMDHRPPFQASMMREPVPIATTAIALYLSDALRGRTESARYFSGERVRYLKLQNLLWVTILAVSAFAAVRRFTASFWLAMLGGALAVSPFTWFLPQVLKSYIGVDSLDTDLMGTAFLSAAAFLLALAVGRRSVVLCLTASLCFGVLALTKASLFYVYVAVLGVLFAYAAAQAGLRRVSDPGRTIACAAALTLPFLLVSLSWMTRNYVQTGFFAIAERGGPVLLYRAYLNDVTATEYLGAFSAWGSPIPRVVAGKLTGFGAGDLEAGGRLQRLAMQLSGAAQEREVQAEDSGEPDRTITWYRKSRAVYNELLVRYAAAGHRYPSGAADQETRNDAVRLIEQHPVKHALLMIPLLWKGALTTFPLLALTLVLAWRRQRTDLMVYILPPLVLVVFLAGATHFSERYGYVPAPEGTTCCLVLLSLAAARWLPRRRDS